jgi:hypothetical protein
LSCSLCKEEGQDIAHMHWLPTTQCADREEQVSAALHWPSVRSIDWHASVLQDRSSSYHQIKIHEEDVLKTAFSTRYSLYGYLVMSFGLTNAPANFMYLMNSVFMAELDKFVVTFIDDILVFSKNKNEHEGHLCIVLQWLCDHQFYVKYSKCEF